VSECLAAGDGKSAVNRIDKILIHKVNGFFQGKTQQKPNRSAIFSRDWHTAHRWQGLFIFLAGEEHLERLFFLSDH
jgi:hypothetical protein